MKGFAQWLWGLRFILLLAGLILIILASPFADNPGPGRLALQLAFTMLAMFGFFLTHRNRTYFWLVVVTTAGWLVVGWGGRSELLPGALLWLPPALLIFVCCVIFFFVEEAVLRAPIVNANVLCGGIGGYLLIGLSWALSFAVAEMLMPGSIKTSDEGREIVWSDFIYFSFTCLTTLGFGDILAVNRFVRIWATMETVFGVLYTSVFVARLVTLYQVRKPE